MTPSVEEKKKSLPFPVASIIIIIYLVAFFVVYHIEEYYLNEIDWINNILFFAAAVLLLIRKPTVLIPLTFAGSMLTYLYLLVYKAIGYFNKHFYDHIHGNINEELLIDFFLVILYLCQVIAMLLLMIHSLDFSGRTRGFFGELWMFPAAFELIGVASWYIGIHNMDLFPNVLPSLLLDVLHIICLALLGAWFASATKDNPRSINYTGSDSSHYIARPEEGYCDMVKHVLFLWFFGPIWYLIWYYRVTRYLNIAPDTEYRNPTAKLFMYLFIPFYKIYWTYQSAKRIDILARSKHVQSDITTITVLLEIVEFLPSFFTPIIMQKKMNQIAYSPYNYISVKENGTDVQIGTADELKKYKELLDDGVITQEEFESVKKKMMS